MATSLPEEETDITKCSICLDEFKIPKYLPCLHTFCEPCLDWYITSAFQKPDRGVIEKSNATSETFKCPVCRCPTKPQNVSTPYNEWAGQFPLNHLIVTLIDQNKLKMKVKQCDPCHSEKADVEAVSWCSDCNEALCENCLYAHKKLKISKHHLVQNIKEMTAPHITSLQHCSNHKGKNIDAFCVDHDQPCCTTCIAIHHRKCDHVTTLEEAAAGSSKSETFSDILNRLKETRNVINEMLKEKRENADSLNHQKLDIQNELKKFRMKVNKHLDELESTAMQEISNVHKQKVIELTEVIGDLENMVRVVQNCTDIMETCKCHASDTHAFLEMKKIGQRQKEQEETLQDILSGHKRYDLKFEGEKTAEEIITSVKRFGRVTIDQRDCPSNMKLKPRKSVSLNVCIPNKISSFCVKEKYGDTDVYGGKFLPDKSILLALLNCKKLVRFNNTGDIVQQISLPHHVYDVTMIDTNTAVVSRYNEAAIDFVDVRTFTVTKTISVGDNCWGIILDNDKLYIGCNSKLVVLQTNGDKVNEVSLAIGLNSVAVIKSGERKIVYVNYQTNTCHFLRASDLKEMHTFTHDDLKAPYSVTTDRDGNVYIAGFSSGNVFQLSSEGELLRILLSGINGPSAIQFDGDSNRFFLAHSGSSAVIDIYELVPPD